MTDRCGSGTPPLPRLASCCIRGADAPDAETTSTWWQRRRAMCTSTPSTRRRAMRRSQSSEPKHTRAIATTRYPTAVGCRRFLPTGPACCAVGACRGCKRRGTPACWTFGSRGIRSAPVVERSGLRERCTGSWRIETSRRGLTHEVAAERATTGHARRAGSSGDAFSGPRDAEPTVLGRRHPGAARRPSLWCR
jgi:hypothetical protein